MTGINHAQYVRRHYRDGRRVAKNSGKHFFTYQLAVAMLCSFSLMASIKPVLLKNTANIIFFIKRYVFEVVGVGASILKTFPIFTRFAF